MAHTFVVGQRVELTEAARDVFPQRRLGSDRGIVLAVSSKFVRVHRDGIKNPEKWSVIYWQPEAQLK